MRSILSADAYQQIADNCSRQDKPLAPLGSISSQQCMSVTGQPLSFSGTMVTKFALPGCDYRYDVKFMVCNNLLQPLQCILGWDFIVAHKLQLSFLGGSYGLVGPHGCTPLNPWNSLSTSFPTCPAPSSSPREESSPCFTQSTSQGPVPLALVDSISIPSRSEHLLVVKTPRGYSNQLGMVSPHDKSDDCHYVVAFTLNNATADSKVSVRVMNPSDSPIQLYKGQKIAQFQPVFESISTPTQLSSSQICGSINSMAAMEPGTFNELEGAINPQLLHSDRQALLNTLLNFPDVFNSGLGHTSVTDHKIDTGDSPPIRQYPRRLPYQFREEVDKQVTEMLSQNVIQRSTSPWASPVVFVKKKDGTYRFCIDYRKLNLVTKQNANPLPRVDDLLDALNGYSIFSTLDLRSGYWQVSMCPKDREKTAFMTPNGLFEFLRMPYGLSTAPATFSRAISIVLSGLTYEICLCYFDDVIIFSKDMQQHCERFSTVLERFRNQNLRVKASKCSFGCDNVVYLGHSVSKYGIHADPAKVKAIRGLAPPSTLEELRSFLGLAGYYRRFIPRFATIASPLTELTKKGVKFVWTENTESAFQHLKTCLCSAPILAYPSFDNPFILQTDASDVGLGAVLTQLDKSGHERVVSYASRTLTGRERNYTAMEHYGVGDRNLSWFESYLSSRKQFCRVNGIDSKTERIEVGVPQGSCLGPLLFLVYINDLPCAVKRSTTSMYADDTTLFFRSKNIEDLNEAINNDLRDLDSWLSGNKLSLNVAKTQGMLLCTKNKHKSLEGTGESICLKIRDNDLALVENTKYLGVQVDNSLDWKEHIKRVSTKVSRAVGLLKYAKRFLPQNSLNTLYTSIIEPHFRYCCAVWGCCGTTEISKLQKLQNRAARIITNSSFDASSKPLIQKLGWKTVNDMIKHESRTMVYKSINNKAPPYMSEMFTRNSQDATRQLRNTNTDLRLPKIRTCNGQKSFSFRGAKLWNSLNNEAKLATSLNRFKSLI